MTVDVRLFAGLARELIGKTAGACEEMLGLPLDYRPTSYALLFGTEKINPGDYSEEIPISGLSTSGTGDPKVSLTTERSVAEYWACLAVAG